jgi:hypothetical protein
MSWSETAVEHALADVLARLDADRAAAGWGGPAWLVELRAPADYVTHPLAPGLHPLSVLDGFTAPPEWDGIGVVCEGQARALPPGRRRVGRALVMQLVARDGTTAAGLRLRGRPLQVATGTPGGAVMGALGGPAVGPLPLALRRTLGLLTVEGGRC